jgi:hypothetical protein
MLTQEITCPYCNFDFSAAVWVDGKCDKCGGSYYWSIESNDDFTDSWHIISWDRDKSIYIATTLANWKRARAFIDFFKSLQIPIAFDWTIWGEEITANKTRRDTNPDSLQQKALCEYDGVATASYVLVIIPTGCGTNFEYGIAYQRLNDTNPPTITILDETEPTAPVSFHYLPGVKRMKFVRDVIKDILVHFDIDIKNINVDLIAYGLGDNNA